MRRIGQSLGLLALASLLAACGEGGASSGASGGGATAGTPTPTPSTPTPTPANTALSNLMFDGDLATITGETSESFAAGSTTSNTITTAYTPLFLHYTAATQGYTLTASGNPQTFAQSDIDPSRSFPGLVFYAKTGGINDTFSRVRPSTAAAVPTYYVGAGGWTRTGDVAGSGPSSRADAFVYGFPTATTAVPTTGTRRYAVDALAFEYLGGPIVAGAERVTRRIGEGEINIDFAAHTVTVTFVGHSAVDAELVAAGIPVPTPPTYTGTGTIAADGTFAGQIDCAGCTPGSALTPTTFRGSLYGPAAEEVGLTYAEGLFNLRGTGALIGHQRGLFDHDVTDTTFSGQQTSLSAGAQWQTGMFNYNFAPTVLGADNRFSTITDRYYVSVGLGTSTSSSLFVQRENAFSFAATIPAEATPQYNVYGYAAPATADSVAADHRLYVLNPTAVDAALILHYVQLGRYERRETTGRQIDIFFASGNKTPPGGLPTSGTGHYTGAIGGQYLPIESDNTATRYYLVGGTLDITVNYATYAITGGMHLFAKNMLDNTTTDMGVFQIIGSGVDGNGVINAGFTTNPNPFYTMLTGSIRARLFGPSGGEFGGQFSFRTCHTCGSPTRLDAGYGAMVGLKIP